MMTPAVLMTICVLTGAILQANTFGFGNHPVYTILGVSFIALVVITVFAHWWWKKSITQDEEQLK